MINVLIIDDSELVRELLTTILSQDRHIKVVGTAVDPIDARTKIKQLNPDVITLDIEMPRMDGITFLKNLIRLRPMPVVMISTLTEKGADITLEALQLGAVDFIPKPKLDVRTNLAAMTQEIIAKVKLAAKVNVATLTSNLTKQQSIKPITPMLSVSGQARIKFIAIGASTGGTEAIKQVLLTLPNNMPPILIVQHMPPGFTASFANRLDSMLAFRVSEFSQDKIEPQAGHAYIANGAQHMTLRKKGDLHLIQQDSSDPVNRHKPSVDRLFESIACCSADRAVAVILTGMGVDGASGMKKMLEAGAATIAQDQSSSVVWGMPRVAVEQGAAEHVLPLSGIGAKLVELCLS